MYRTISVEENHKSIGPVPAGASNQCPVNNAEAGAELFISEWSNFSSSWGEKCKQNGVADAVGRKREMRRY